jgi:hypothetical protein
MRTRALTLLLLAVLAGPASAADPVAVVELFTSEGCSSCPPADRLLSRIAAEPAARNGRLVCLAYHVDYWNRLGWPDRFSDAAFSARQRSYAEALGEARVFTPQAVVNGTRSLVGSDERGLRAAITSELERPAVAGLVLRIEPGENPGELRVRVRVDDTTPPAMVRVAVVEDGLVTRVQRGENAGRTLHHDCVVRAVDEGELTDGTVTVRLAVPSDLVVSRSRVVALVQDADTLRVLGAATASLR